tara:strand:- start:11903 stop:12571 length:669 start_codon:yes stop_codon:yes gene_type:complete
MALNFSQLKPKNLLDAAKVAGGFITGNPMMAAAGGAALYGAIKKGPDFFRRNTGIGNVNPTTNMRERILGGDVGRLLQQREGLAQQMIQGMPGTQQQQVFGTAADEAAMQNQQMERNVAMQGIGAPSYQNMLSAVNQQRSRGNAAQSIANLQPQYMQQGMNELAGIQNIYQDVNTAGYNQAFADYQQGQQSKGTMLQGLLEHGGGLLKGGMDLYNTYKEDTT